MKPSSLTTLSSAILCLHVFLLKNLVAMKVLIPFHVFMMLTSLIEMLVTCFNFGLEQMTAQGAVTPRAS